VRVWRPRRRRLLFLHSSFPPPLLTFGDKNYGQQEKGEKIIRGTFFSFLLRGRGREGVKKGTRDHALLALLPFFFPFSPPLFSLRSGKPEDRQRRSRPRSNLRVRAGRQECVLYFSFPSLSFFSFPSSPLLSLFVRERRPGRQEEGNRRARPRERPQPGLAFLFSFSPFFFFFSLPPPFFSGPARFSA